MALAIGLIALALPGAAFADHPQPIPPDITQMEYVPIGKYGPAGQNRVVAGETPSTTIPATNSPLAPTNGLKYNPSGKYVAYDTNLFETLTLPFRAAGDTAANDPPGNDFPPPGGGSPNYGQCDPSAPPDPDGLAPLTPVAGRCPNHHLEYLDYFEETMEEILGPFGVTVKRYPFQSPGSGNTKSGQAHNIAAVVPGADHPDETVLVSGHYDQTTEGPASAWDSAEGHAQVIRMAKIMADYWTATGTRPSATIKFVPWDQEESGLLGSADYVANIIPPGEEDKVRAYFNVDPCAGAYPAFYRGSLDRVPLTLQLVNPDDHEGDADFQAEVTAFNARAETIVDEVFDELDDELVSATASPTGPQPIYVSDAEAAAMGIDSQRDEIPTTLGGLLLFTSDYSNFEEIGVPFFNLSPAFFGPSADGTPNRQDGIALLHTPDDNHRNINALTSVDQTGSTVSEGWAKGMELCAQLESWYMLQPEMAGGQTANQDVVAYYEALPNEAIRAQAVSFDAAGSYQRGATPGTFVPDASLTYSWDFGDGTTGTGKTVQHSYAEIGRYTSVLTVTNTATGLSDTMTIPITVIGSNFRPPVLGPLPEEDPDGSFPLAWEFEADRDGFERFSVEESTDFQTLFIDDAEGPLDARWTANAPEDPKLEPWQPSDSSTPKFRGNQASSGARSYWTGVSPQNFAPAPLNQTSTLTMNQPIAVPATGDPVLSYANLFQSEGDDQGRVEVALTDGITPADELDWQPVDIVAATQTALGTTDRAICNPAEPETFTTGFETRTADLGAYRGKTILVRFAYLLGGADRALSQPCGWYVDDIRLASGTFAQIATTPDQAFEVTGRAAGTYAYRILGVYADGVRTAPSNIEVIRVTAGGGDGGGGEDGGGGGDGTGGDGQDGPCSNLIEGTKRSERLEGTSGSDRILGKDGRDRLKGKRGDDCLRGGAGRDRIGGGGGDDEIRAGRGRDRVVGGGGDDVIRVADGGRDRVDCGRGKDTVFAHPRKDEVARNCEKVRSG